MDACIEALQRALAGERFEYEGRPVWMATRPATPGGPPLWIGGHSKPAVRRAARLGLGVMTEGGTGLQPFYEAECAKHGREPGPFIDPPPGSPSSVFIAEDPDRAWSDYGPYLLHDAQMYAQWMGSDHESISKSTAASVDDLRSEQDGAYRILTPDEAVELARTAGMIATQPLCGGLPPELAWKSLRLLTEKVRPRLGG